MVQAAVGPLALGIAERAVPESSVLRLRLPRPEWEQKERLLRQERKSPIQQALGLMQGQVVAQPAQSAPEELPQESAEQRYSEPEQQQEEPEQAQQVQEIQPASAASIPIASADARAIRPAVAKLAQE